MVTNARALRLTAPERHLGTRQLTGDILFVLQTTTLHSKCACPGKCSGSSNGLSTGEIVGIV